MEIHPVSGFWSNLCFWCPFFSWITAQLIKMAINFAKTRNIDFHYLVSTGGMPSAHSATVSGLATAIGITQGFDSPLFAICLVYAIITMFDASTVRRAAGQQAKILNIMIHDVFKEHKIYNAKLRELLGHTRTEVWMGMLLGIVFSASVCLIAARVAASRVLAESGAASVL
jgi:Uncharacterized protein conserved in bacteria